MPIKKVYQRRKKALEAETENVRLRARLARARELFNRVWSEAATEVSSDTIMSIREFLLEKD